MTINNQLSGRPMINLTPKSQPDVEIFDPPMCCPTGLCGPVLDQTLLDTSEMIDALQEAGFQVERYQMSGQPQAFLGNADVMKRVQEKQLEALPIISVHGRIVAEGYYPKLSEMKQHLNGAN